MEVVRDLERAGEQERGFSYRPHFLDLIDAGGMPEEEARKLAYRLVKRAREEGGRHAPEAAAPSPEELEGSSGVAEVPRITRSHTCKPVAEGEVPSPAAGL